MRYLILSDRDRERFGCPDKMPFEWGRLTNKEVALLPKLGFKSLAEVHRMLGQYVEEGVSEESIKALDVVVWLALRRSGVHVPYDENFEYDLDMEWFDDDPSPAPAVEEDPGKAPGSAAPRKSSPRTAPSSSRTSRRK
jgi:hypothetical protein